MNKEALIEAVQQIADETREDPVKIIAGLIAAEIIPADIGFEMTLEVTPT